LRLESSQQLEAADQPMGATSNHPIGACQLRVYSLKGPTINRSDIASLFMHSLVLLQPAFQHQVWHDHKMTGFRVQHVN